MYANHFNNFNRGGKHTMTCENLDVTLQLFNGGYTRTRGGK